MAVLIGTCVVVVAMIAIFVEIGRLGRGPFD